MQLEAASLSSVIFIVSEQLFDNDDTQAVALDDLDNDGDIDAFAANVGPNRVWFNDGQGRFTAGDQQLGEETSPAVALGDLDGDGDTDAFVGNRGGPVGLPDEVWFNDGQGNFADSGQRIGYFTTEKITLGDVDDDGDLDALIITCGGFNDPNQLWLNDGQGNFTESGQDFGTLCSSALGLDDLDNDGDLDAFIGHAGSSSLLGVHIWLNDGNGVFTKSEQELESTYNFDVALGDLDGDGDLDAFTANGYYVGAGASNKIWFNDGSGHFTKSEQELGYSQSTAVFLADFDEDGDLDAFVRNGNYNLDQASELWFNDGSGYFTESNFSMASLKNRDLAVADFDSDGDLDVFAGNTGSNALWNNVDPAIFTHTFYLPFVSKQLPPPPVNCSDIEINISPSKPTYEAGETVQIIISGVQPGQGTPYLYWTRSTANTQLGSDVWIPLELQWNGAKSQYDVTWEVTDILPGTGIYSTSKNQEFIFAFNLWDGEKDKFLCVGNPDPHPDDFANHSELSEALCENCRKVLVSRSPVSDLTTALNNYWNIEAGYSLTYQGDRLDAPQDDNGNPISVTFNTRMEYEAPVRICDIPLFPQRWTKDSRWGYWLPSAAKQADRDGSIWTEGNTNLRFFLTAPDNSLYSYPWEGPIIGAYAHKIYEVTDDAYKLGYLGDTFNRTIIHTSRNHENYYYPPYLLSYDAVPNMGKEEFVRIDSIYSYHGTETPDSICKTRIPTEAHPWYVSNRFLTDSDLKNEFNTIQGYFDEAKNIVVLTFFEGDVDGQLTFREDWYLMEDVGLVGVDQASWDEADTNTASLYVNADFMKEGTPATPHTRIRADRGYFGDALEITPVAPQTSFPLTVPAGSCYTVAVHSTTSTPLPYDGYLEQNGSDPPILWRSAINDEPLWVNNGMVEECIPDNFPSGEYKVRLRSHITTTPSEYEENLAYDTTPWSTNYLWIIVP